MTGLRVRCGNGAMVEVRLDAGKSPRFSGSVPSNDRLAASTPAAGTIYDCPNPPKRKSLPEIAGNLLEWTAPDGIERARMRSLQISDKGTVRGTD